MNPSTRCAGSLVVVLLAGAAVAADGPAQAVDRLIGQYHEIGQFNGSALVADGGQVVLKKGYGLANMEWQIPNAPDTKFRLGSITKQFTAALVLQQVEKGKLRLDGHIADYLPDYRKDVGEKVTIHLLLAHTSGIPSYTASPALPEISRGPHNDAAEFVKTYCSGTVAVAVLEEGAGLEDRGEVGRGRQRRGPRRSLPEQGETGGAAGPSPRASARSLQKRD